MPIDAERIAYVLGGRATLLREVRTPQELRAVVDEGLPLGALDQAVRHALGEGAAAAEVKHRIVPRTTYHRRQGRKRARLSAEESQRTERLARMTALAGQVFEGEELAREFLSSPQPALGGERPVDLIRSDLGTREVEDLLLALEYSLPV